MYLKRELVIIRREAVEKKIKKFFEKNGQGVHFIMKDKINKLRRAYKKKWKFRKPPKTFQKYADIMAKGTWKEGDIRGFKMLINKHSHTEDKIIKIHLRHLLEKFDSVNEYNITPEQTQKGIDFIRKKVFRKDGKGYYKNCTFGKYEIDIINNFSHFKFVDVHNASQGCWACYYPVYRVYDKEGNYFDYYYLRDSSGFGFNIY